jgi:molybdenum cofactor guanylyltransferase
MSPPTNNTTTGVILAGGKSSRMGSNKALLRINGKTFIEYIAGTLRHVVSDIIIIADQREEFEFLALPIYPDIYKDHGPLGGIHSAFMHTDTPEIIAVTCDMPLVEASLVVSLLIAPLDADAAFFSDAGFIYPFPGLYRRTCLPQLEQNLGAKKNSVIGLIRMLTVTAYPIPRIQKSNPFTQINDSSDYHKFREECL